MIRQRRKDTAIRESQSPTTLGKRTVADFQKANSLSAADSLFLYFERQGQPVNIAAVAAFEGMIPPDLCTAYIESKLPLMPRYLQRAVTPPYEIDLPAWEPDPNFDVRNHVRKVTLKRGTEAEFKAVAARILSDTMNRERPLWDFTLVHGLEGNRTGAVVRIHHCLADGIAGIKLLNAIMDASPTPLTVAPQRLRQARARRPREKSLLDELIGSSISAVQRLLTAESDLLGLAKYVVAGAERQLNGDDTPAPNGFDSDTVIPALGKLKRLLPELAMATRLPFNVVCRGPQKFRWTEIPFAEIRAVKQACGATVNDVVLTIVTAAVRRYAQLHGVRLRGRTLRIMVPVNVRTDGDGSELGNQITFLPVNIPMDIDGPRELMEAVREAVARSRSAQTAELISLIGTLVAAIPAPVQALIGPIFSQLPLSVCNLICTNVPGPQMPLYLLGHKLLSVYPYVPIGGEMGMNCAVLTYDGTAFFGFTGDAHAIPDLDRLEKFLDRSFAELRKGVGVHAQRTKPRRRQPQAAPAPQNPAEEEKQGLPAQMGA